MSKQYPTHPSHELTLFTTLPAQFPNASEKIRSKEFLEASSAAISLVERFGKVFAPVINDMNGNIRKIYRRYEKDTECNEYLEEMILREQTEGESVATDALMWLRRALHFLSLFYQSIIDDTQSERCSNDLAPFLKKAYSETLEPFHGWLGSQLFNVLARFAPHRRNLIFVIGLEKPNRDQDVIRDMRNYNNKMMACIRRLSDFYTGYGLETYATV